MIAAYSRPSAVRDDVERSRQTLEKLLTHNLVPFWYSNAIDSEYGGYRLNHDGHGAWKGDFRKSLVTQARTLWFFSRLCGSRFSDERFRRAARHGFEFLCESMWDDDSGGFYWQVDASGENVTMPHKHLYGQAAALYALSEYAHATGDMAGLRLARRLFECIQRHAYDAKHGGYIEFFLRNWTPPSPDTRGYVDDVSGPLKLMNTHLHIMEATRRYYVVTRDPLARDRVVELSFILSNAVVRKEFSACTDRYERDWRPLGGVSARVSYGHDLENMWLLIDAFETLGIPVSLVLDLYRAVFANSLRYGFDKRDGGFYESGPLNRAADRRTKVWWVQAEAMISALYLYLLTDESEYFAVFQKTLSWIERYQADWKNGEWHRHIDGRGQPMGDKADDWKGPYHTGRAVLSCWELLSGIATP